MNVIPERCDRVTDFTTEDCIRMGLHPPEISVLGPDTSAKTMPIPACPPIPDGGDSRADALTFLKSAARGAAIRSLIAELERLRHEAEGGLATVEQSPTAMRAVFLGAPRLAATERKRRVYLARKATLEGAAPPAFSETIESFVLAGLVSARPDDAASALEQIRAGYPHRIAELEGKLRVCADSANQPRGNSGGAFHQDALLEEVESALAERKRLLSTTDDLGTVRNLIM
jgi:hypothetical protein